MKKLNKALLIMGMALSLGGGIGAAVAGITANQATVTGEGNFDKAITLYWDEGSSSATLEDMTDLVVNQAAYRVLNVSSKSTKSVAGTVTLTFTLAAGTVEAGKTASIADLSINVYSVEAGTTQAQAEALDYSALTPVATVNSTTTVDTAEIAITAAAAAQTVSHCYAIEVVYSGATILGANEVLAGNLTISQSFLAA